MMYPFIALLSSLGIFGLLFWVLNIISKLKIEKIKLWSLLLLGGIFVMVFSFFSPKEKLLIRQTEKQKKIFSVELNEKLYEYFSDKVIDGKILTNYPVDYLPGFENTQKSIIFNDVEQLLTGIKEQDTYYLLYPTNVSDEIQFLIDDLESKGKLKIVFDTESWIPYNFAVLMR